MKWKVLFITIASTALVFLDSTVVPVALPTIQRELNFSDVGGMWIVNVYLLALVSLLLVGGRLIDLFGRRTLFQIGFLLFFIGSLGGGFSIGATSLIISRFVQGLGGALLLPATGSLLIASFPLNKRARAIGINSGISSLFLIIGPVIGGALTAYVNWRAIFLINIPVVLFGFIMARQILVKEARKEGTFHFLGALLLSCALTCLVTALMEGPLLGWTTFSIFALFGGFLFFFALFLLATYRTATPLIDKALFASPLFRGALMCISLTQLAIIVTVQWAVYFQEGLKFTPMETGGLILMATLPVLFIAPLGGVIADKFGARPPILAGFVILALSLLALSVTAHEEPSLALYPSLLAFGTGVAAIFSPAFAAAMTDITPTHLGIAASILTTSRQLAATLGIAATTALSQSIYLSTHSRDQAFFATLYLSASFALLGFFAALFFLKRKHK